MNTSLVDKWIEYHQTQNKELFWAWEQLDDAVHDSPNEAFEYILSIAQTTTDPLVLSNLGAGPLEDLLVYHGAEYIDQVETKARQIPQFTQVVKSVWKNNMSNDVWERISAIKAKYS